MLSVAAMLGANNTGSSSNRSAAAAFLFFIAARAAFLHIPSSVVDGSDSLSTPQGFQHCAGRDVSVTRMRWALPVTLRWRELSGELEPYKHVLITVEQNIFATDARCRFISDRSSSWLLRRSAAIRTESVY